MIESHEFLKSVLDTVPDHIAVIDQQGRILYVNRCWRVFGQENNCRIDCWNGVNYLDVCDRSISMDNGYGFTAANGIRKVINAEQELFYFEYPCHSPGEERWFMMRITPFTLNNTPYYVISHHNITERKLAEEEVLKLSRIDGLTNIPNRRCFDEFVDREWRRCARLGMPLSCAIVDIDHFKLLNDTYGHQTGDDCLKIIGKVLEKFMQRPGDICARYGGEEFAIAYSNTALEESLMLVRKMVDAVRALMIPNEKSPTLPILTISAGLATMHPNKGKKVSDLIKVADTLLYSAKANGRNRVVFQYCQ